MEWNQMERKDENRVGQCRHERTQEWDGTCIDKNGGRLKAMLCLIQQSEVKEWEGE